MSEDEVNLLSISSFLSGMSSSKQSFPDPIMGVEVDRCSIGVVRVVVQVFQNCFTGIPNPTRSSRLGGDSQVFTG